jgi:RNA polymerase sigma factor (sigma-70 family)
MEEEPEEWANGARRASYGRRDGAARRRPLGPVDDTALVDLARRGSQLAWDELVRRFSGLIGSVARRYGLAAADAADIAQVTWVSLYCHLDDLRKPGSIGAWLATTARHECLRVVGSRRERPVDPSDVAEALPTGDDPVDDTLAGERREAVRQAIDQIPRRSQELLELLIWEERSYQDISAATGMAIGSIGPTRERALRRLARRPELARLVAGDAPAA